MAVRGEHGGLFVANNPVMKTGLLSQSIVEGDIVNAGDAEAAANSTTQQRVYDGLRCRDLGCNRRSGGG